MATSSLSVSFKKYTEETAAPRNVVLVVRDYTTEEVLSGASVQVSGSNGYYKLGVTSSTGQLELGVLKPGTYSLVVVKANYQSSTTDYLANDTFTI